MLDSWGANRVYGSGHIKDHVPLKKSRALCPSGRFRPSFIHQVIIITRLTKLYDSICSHHEDGLRCRLGVKPSLKQKTKQVETCDSLYRCYTTFLGEFE